MDIQSLQELDRMHIEEYLIYLDTEAHDRKNYTDLYALRRVIEDVGNLYERQHMASYFGAMTFQVHQGMYSNFTQMRKLKD